MSWTIRSLASTESISSQQLVQSPPAFFFTLFGHSVVSKEQVAETRSRASVALARSGLHGPSGPWWLTVSESCLCQSERLGWAVESKVPEPFKGTPWPSIPGSPTSPLSLTLRRMRSLWTLKLQQTTSVTQQAAQPEPCENEDIIPKSLSRLRMSPWTSQRHSKKKISATILAVWLGRLSGGRGGVGRGGGRSKVAWELSGFFACCYHWPVIVEIQTQANRAGSEPCSRIVSVCVCIKSCLNGVSNRRTSLRMTRSSFKTGKKKKKKKKVLPLHSLVHRCASNTSEGIFTLFDVGLWPRQTTPTSREARTVNYRLPLSTPSPSFRHVHRASRTPTGTC